MYVCMYVCMYLCNPITSRTLFGEKKRVMLAPVVYQAFDNGEFIISILLDLTKAGDLINRSYLLDKLPLYGIRDIENDWIRIY